MNLTYFIIPGTYNRNDVFLKIHNQLYTFWHSNWVQVFSNLSQPVDIKNSEFRRQSFIAALINNSDEVIGLTLHTLFNLNSLADCHHHYFTNNYSNQFILELKQKELSKVLSIEFLTVSEKYRKREAGFSVAKFLVSLSHRIQSFVNAEASISSCRKDLHIDKLESQFGGEQLNPPGLFYGVETQNLITYTKKLQEPQELKSHIDLIWNNKIWIDVEQPIRNEKNQLHKSLFPSQLEGI